MAGTDDARAVPGRMNAATDVATGEDLARFLDPTGDPFTMLLLQLAAAADKTRRAALRQAFPREVVAWEIWSQLEEIPTAGRLIAMISLVWWPGRNGIPAAETIAFMVRDYQGGKVLLREVTRTW